MKRPDSIDLFIEEALEAVCIDFRRYDPQIILMCQIIHLILGDRIVLKREGIKKGAWISMQGQPNMRWITGPELVEIACAAVKEADPEAVSSICARVFHTRATEQRDPATGKTRIRIETGMEGFSCRQCGRCCACLDYHDALTEKDVAQWEKLGRTDILKWVRVLDTEAPEKAYRIWTVPGTTRLSDSCPFLKKIPSKNRWECLIHDVKPEFCREYPFSRKHGLMTACPGFDTKKGVKA